MNFRTLIASAWEEVRRRREAAMMCSGTTQKTNLNYNNKLLPFDSLSLQVTRYPMPSLFFNLFLMIYFEANIISNKADKEVWKNK